ncbi:MAG: sulfatase [Muribaculaceae bacterium]|nr:sulfatase [Muribaculaceae bacterium]
MAGAAIMLPAVLSAQTAQKPNIIFMLIDDMGWLDSTVGFGEENYPLNYRHHTPNMQRLAERGTIFTNAYACPLSSPTRTSLMSGMNAAHTRITNFTTAFPGIPSDGTHKPEVLKDDVLVHPEWNWHGISTRDSVANTAYMTPMAKILKDAGYYTIHIGKGHMATATTPAASSYNLGFCVAAAGQLVGKPLSYSAKDNYGNYKDRWTGYNTMNLTEYYGSDTHLTEAITLEAMKALEFPVKNKIPFYLYLAHHAVHTPIQADPRFAQRYLDEGLDQGQASFASLVEGVDKSLGDILEYIDSNGIADNTIIIFMSDNGGNSENKAKGGVPHTQNLPLREGKASCYEGGIRVPLMVFWPGKTAAGTRLNTPVIAEDMFPTILEMAGIHKYSTVQELDGKSLVRLITDGSRMAKEAMESGKIKNQKEANEFVIDESVTGIPLDRELVFHFPHQWKPYHLEDIDYMTSMRKGDWKIVYRHRTQTLELYNLGNDLGERNDLSRKNKKKLKEMARALSDRLRGWDAVMPTIRATGERIPYPDEIVR